MKKNNSKTRQKKTKKDILQFIGIIAILLFFLIPTHAKNEKTVKPYKSMSIIHGLRSEFKLTFCNEAVPLSNQEVKERFEKEMLLMQWDKPQVFLWLKRSTRYFPIIEKELLKRGLPDDLKYIVVVESAFRPHIGSSKGAVGFWQLMPETARNNGLTVSKRIDERRDIVSSTRGALDYLEKLHKDFQNWTLAAAAYNMGEEGLMAEVIEQEVHSFYNLYLSLETQRYILRIIAAKTIIENQSKYGFHMNSNDYYPPFVFEKVKITSRQEIPMGIIAKAANTTFKQIKDLNPHIRGYYIMKGIKEIRVPKGSSDGFHERFKTLVSNHKKSKKDRIYTIKKGDNLSTIAKDFNVPLQVILIWNRMSMKKNIYPGEKIVIYSGREKTKKR